MKAKNISKAVSSSVTAYSDPTKTSSGVIRHLRSLRWQVMARVPDAYSRKILVRQATAYLLILLFVLQSNLAIAAAGHDRFPAGHSGAAPIATEVAAGAPGFLSKTYSWLFGSDADAVNESAAAVEPPSPPPVTGVSGAAISRHHPSLNGGTIQGDLRVFSGESYAINSAFHLTGDLYSVGTPTITVNSGASHGGVINDGGSTTPSGYSVTLNSGVVIPGKIHIRANALTMPTDIPTSVPNPTGTRTVNINTAADVNTIGNWATVRTLNINPANLTINVPPGNYDTISTNGSNIHLVFSTGTYNFSGTININSGSTVQASGATTINIGQSLNVNAGSYLVAAGTAPADVKLNVIGTSVSVNSASQISAIVRAVNATVNLNSATIRGQIIANYLNINSGQIIGDTNPADTTAPTLSITAPQNNSTTTSTTANVSGTASDAGSGIASVTVNGSAAAYNPGTGAWSFANLNLALGSNVITVQATDVAGNVTTQTVTVIRQLPPDTIPPTISITSPANNSTTGQATVAVSGMAADSGPGATGINRVVVNGVQAQFNSGTGVWSIAALPLNEGANAIQAVAFDNASPQNSGTASIVVTRQTPDTQAPTLQVISPANNSETYDSTLTMSGTATDTGLNATGVGQMTVNGQPAGYNSATGQWSLANIALNIGNNTFVVIARDNAVTPNQSQVTWHVMRQQIPAPTISISTPANNTATTDAAIPVAGFATAFATAGNSIMQVTVNGSPASYDPASGAWHVSSFALSLGTNTIIATATDIGGRTATAQVTVTRNPVNQPPTVNAGPDQAITLPAAASLAGSASDDGLPQGSTLTTVWSKVSGPGDVAFSNPSALATTASFSLSGDYVLRLTASDSQLTTSDEVLITVSPANQAPVVNAGPDQAITLPAPANLAGSASDDGLPQGSTLTTVWSKVSGPGDVAFSDPAALASTATFSLPGDYVLRLTASDSLLTTSDEVLITVSPANQAPVVNAGSDQSVALPASATLAGTVTDDGLPQASTVSSVWSKVSGPGDVTFADPNSPATTATFSQAGDYVLRLTATDGALTASDDVAVSVSTGIVAPAANFTVPGIGGPVQLSVVPFSSTTTSSPALLLDENRNTFWISDSPQNTNQSVKFEIAGGEQLIQRFRFQQPPFEAAYMVRDFIVQVSTTTTDDSAFTTVLGGTLQANADIQEVSIPGVAVNAKYVKLIAVNNNGADFLSLSMFQVVGAAGADNIVSLPGRHNAAWNGSPSILSNGAAISRSTSYGTTPVDLINGGTWKTNTKTNEFVVIKLTGDQSHSIKGIRMAANYQDYINYWVRNFEVWVSNTVDDDSAFTKVLDGEKNSVDTEDFLFPGGPVSAKYIKYVPLTTRGSAPFIGTMAIEAISDESAAIDSFSCESAFGRVDRALDRNNIQSSWYCEQGNGANQWVKFRLDGPDTQKVTGVRIGGDNIAVFGAFYGPRNIEIRVSTTTNEDAAFSTVYTGVLSTTRDIQDIRFAQPIDAKYVQFYWVDGYTSYQISTHTIEVLTLANDGATITDLSGQGDVNMPPERALDLSQGEIGWQSVGGQTTDQSMTIRLYNGELFDIDHVAIRAGTIYPQGGISPKNFDIQTSTTDDAPGSFTTVFSGIVTTPDLLQHFYFPSAPARYVRLFIHDNYGNSIVGLNAFFVFANNTGPTEARFYDHSTSTGSTIVSYDWNFGDGQTGTGQNQQHNYAQAGVYDVALTVTDSNGSSNTKHKTYHALPTLKADFSYTPVTPIESDWYPNTVFFVDRSSSRLNGAGAIGQFTLQGVDQDIPTQSFAQTIFPDNGLYPTTIKFGSDLVLNYRTTKNVSVQNVPPTVDVSDGKTVFWGENWTNPIISLGDTGPADRSTLGGVWNYGDGQSSTCTNCTAANAAGAHAYALPGNYTATLSVTDKDGGTGTDTAAYEVIRRLVTVVFNNQYPQAGNENFVLRAKLYDAFSNQTLSQKPLTLALNGVSFNVVTDQNGDAQVTIPFPVGTRIGIGTAAFAGDDLYQPYEGAFSGTPNDTPPTGSTTSYQGTDFWIAFPPNYDTQSRQRLFVNSRVDTTVSITGCGWTDQQFSVVAGTNTQVDLPSFCYLFPTSFVPAIKGLHLTALDPVTVYGLNQRIFTSDAFLAIPTQSLGKEYYVASWGNLPGDPADPGENSLNGTQFAVIASEDNTTVTITPTVTTADRNLSQEIIRPANVPYTLTLAKGRPYLLWNQFDGLQNDLTGSHIVADKPIVVYGSSITATIPQAAICCADHIVEQMAPVNTWGKRFVTMPLATRTKGDYFRYIASEDGTVVFINGTKAGVINRGQFIEKLVTDPTEIISTKTLMVAQYATSSFFDPGPADPMMMMIAPYSEWLNDYTIATPGTGFSINYLNVTAPTASVGAILLDGDPVPAASFRSIGNGDFSGAQIPVGVGSHRLTGAAKFGVFVYGFSTDEGYGYPGGMDFKPSAPERSLTLTPETASFGINAQACVTTTLTDRDEIPLGGKTVSLNITGANPASQSGTTNAAGKFAFCYTGPHTGTDSISATFENLTASASFVWVQPSQPPTVNAGADQTIVLPAAANLTGSVTDDGNPTNSLTYSWSKVSGPGDVTFADPNSLSTTANFGAEGIYVLRLTASDGALSASDDVKINAAYAPNGEPAPFNYRSFNDSPWHNFTGGWFYLEDFEDHLLNTPGVTAETGGLVSVLFGPSAHDSVDADDGFLDGSGSAGDNFFNLNGVEGIKFNFDRQVLGNYPTHVGVVYTDGAGQTFYEAKDGNGTSLGVRGPFTFPVTSHFGEVINDFFLRSYSPNGISSIRVWSINGGGVEVDHLQYGYQEVPISNTAPAVSAGNARTITLPVNSVTLQGAVSDDGLPAGSSVVATWTKVSGNGNVVFANANQVDTLASFDHEGIYVLRLTATDGELSANADVTITVNPPIGSTPTPTPTPENTAPTVNAGSDQTVKLNANLLKNPGAESDLASGELPDWTEAAGTGWTRLQGETGDIPSARFGDYVFADTADAHGELYQDIDLRAYVEGINAATQSFTWTAYVRSSVEQNADTGRIILEYRDAADQVALGSLDSGPIATTDGWHLTDDERVPPAGTGYLRIRLLTTRNTGPTTDVYFDGMSLKAVGGGAAVKLAGTASDDGLPFPSALVTTWTRTSGGGNVLFGNATALDSSARFDTAGSNTLHLAGTDGQLSAGDDMTVTVLAGNDAPVVNAGADQTITLPATAQLNGSATDSEGTLRYRWLTVSGPGSVSISNAKVPNPTVAFSTAGNYVLRLTVEDGEFETSDDVAVTVSGAAVNQPPTVNAGANQAIQLPVNFVTLNGIATDDGLPSGNTVITWTKTGGAGNVVFSNPNAAVTTATFDAAGGYVLRLTVTDGQYTSFDEVVVTVSPANGGGGTNLPPVVVIGADQTIGLSQTAILEATSLSDDGLPIGAVYTYAWTVVSGPGTVNFTNPTDTATYATFSQTGVYVIRLTASDSDLSGSDDLTVTVVDSQAGPAVEILTPDDGIRITEPTAFTGTVSGGAWHLDYSLTDTDDPVHRVWTPFANGNGAASGLLGTLDTTMMLNGTYDIRLQSEDQLGQSSTDVISVSVEGKLKIGNFTVSFEDMNVPIAGIPIQIIRTYDSRDKRQGDFGYGWTLGVKNLRLEKNTVLGLKWFETVTNTFIPVYCVQATRPHIVSVTMPDGKVQKFEASLEHSCQQAANITGGNLIFKPQPGTQGKLEVIGTNEVAVAGSVPGPVDLIGFDGQGIFDRSSYKYTAKDGTEFIIDQGTGLQSVRDTNNNTLTISSTGITHSSGKSIIFTRDSQGRITQVTDPAGVSNVYAYDTSGDLISFKDRENNTTAFTYEPTVPHHLKSIVDALGRTPIRNEYDTSGRLLKHTDANGNEITYIHNLAARVESVTDRLGNQTTFSYDDRGNVLQKTDALGNTITMSYDANDNVLTETNALGKTTTNTYDAQDNLTVVVDPLGNRTEFTYNSQSRVLTAKDARNNVTTNTYDTAGNLLTTTDAAGNLTTNLYSIGDGLRSRTTDALGHITRFEYFHGYLTKEIDAQNNETTLGYDENGNRSSQTVKRTNALGQLETITTTFEYDDLNRLTKTTLPDGTFAGVEYNELGQQTATINQAGNRTESMYDTLGRHIKTTYPDGTSASSTYDAEGRRLTSTDRAGHVTSFEYDALGRLKKTTFADGTFTQTNYNAAGQAVTSVDARGNTTTITYDDDGRRLSVKNALDQITSFVYDANGNQSSMTDALGHSTSYVYDSLSRKTRTNFADATFTETTYDQLGRKIAEKDQSGKVTQFFYDSLGRLTKVKDAMNQETVYGYDELGQPVSQKDALNRETKYEYDRLGRRTKRILPLGQVESYSYNNAGDLQAKTDFNGKTTTFGYDNMRRLLSKTPDESLNEPGVSFTYNDSGQRLTMTDASGTTSYTYDIRDRLTSKHSPEGTLSYTYDIGSNVKTVRSDHANGFSVDYDYDQLNRLDLVKDNNLVGSQNTTYTYDAVGNLQSYSYPNTVTTNYTYNDLNRLTNLTVASAGGSLASYAYTLGAAGNRTQVIENTNRTVNYVYDDLYRLTNETIANSTNNGTISYQYDAVGNRLNRTSSVNLVPGQASTYDANDRLNSDVYDANGSTKVSDGKSYDYDFENHLSHTSDGISIVYDGDGNRVSKTVGGVTTKYLVDTNNLIGCAQVVEEIVAGQVSKQYSYGLELISQRDAGGNISYYGYDGKGSVRNLTNSEGNATDIYVYDAFGTIIEKTGSTENNYLYAGEQFDPDLGFYYNRARYLNVATGRFISQDAFEGKQSAPASLHKYLFVENNPVNWKDASGFETIAEETITLSIAEELDSIPTYAPLATISEAGLAQFYAETAVETTAAAAEGELGFEISSHAIGLSAFVLTALAGVIATETSSNDEEDEDPQIVYRSIRDDEEPSLGLFAKNPDATYTVEGHIINGGRPNFKSQYISTTTSFSVAQQWAAKYNDRLVAIDLDKVSSPIYNLSTEAGRNMYLKGRTAKNFAKASSEVLIEKYVPPDAVTFLGRL